MNTPIVFFMNRVRRYYLFPLACLVLVINAGVAMSQNAVSWYDVRPEPDIGTVAVRLHAWHDVVAAPDVQGGTIAIVRETMAAERLSRLTSAFDLRAPDDTPVLHWAAREAAAAADSESRRRHQDSRRADRTDGGLLDSWISEHAAAQERRELMADRNDNAFFGSGRETSSRSWGWLADDVMQRERLTLDQEQIMRDRMERDTMGIRHGVPGQPGELPGWQPSAAERTWGGHPAWR